VVAPVVAVFNSLGRARAEPQGPLPADLLEIAHGSPALTLGPEYYSGTAATHTIVRLIASSGLPTAAAAAVLVGPSRLGALPPRGRQ